MTKNSDHNKTAIVKRLNELLSAYRVAYFNMRAVALDDKGREFF